MKWFSQFQKVVFPWWVIPLICCSLFSYQSYGQTYNLMSYCIYGISLLHIHVIVIYTLLETAFLNVVLFVVCLFFCESYFFLGRFLLQLGVVFVGNRLFKQKSKVWRLKKKVSSVFTLYVCFFVCFFVCVFVCLSSF